jgi:large subunit ribosomal protein L25
VQWHPYKPQVLHIDFQRVAADQKIHMKVPLHYKNQEISPAVKLSAALISFVSTDIEVICLPKDLPSFIEVDLSTLEANKSLHIREIPFPEGVAPALRPKENPVIVTASIAVIEEEKPAEGAAPAAAGKGAPAAKAAAKPAAKK